MSSNFRLLLFLLLSLCHRLTNGVASTSYSILIGYLSNDNITIWSLDNQGNLLNNSDIAPNYTDNTTTINSINAGIYTAWMTISPDNQHIYVANHNTPGQSVTVLRMKDQSLINQPIQLSVDAIIPQTNPANPVHMTVTDNALFTVSYSDDSYTTYNIDPYTNNITMAMNRIAACTNAHQIILVPVILTPNSGYNHLVLVPCLGDDTILNAIQGDRCSSSDRALVCNFNIAYSRKNSGPRHLVKHPNKNIVYVMNEKDSSIATWIYDPYAGQMSNPIYMSSLPINASYAGNSSYWAGAEITLSNDAQYLYVSNRALKSNLNSNIGVFRIDSTTGAILPDPVQFTDGDGDVNFPRHFAITPDNRYLLVANQKGKSVTVFSIDNSTQNTGMLTKLNTYPTPGNNPAFVLVVPHTYPPNPVVNSSTGSFFTQPSVISVYILGLITFISMYLILG